MSELDTALGHLWATRQSAVPGESNREHDRAGPGTTIAQRIQQFGAPVPTVPGVPAENIDPSDGDVLERAAILEYDADLDRAEAEARALAEAHGVRADGSSHG